MQLINQAQMTMNCMKVFWLQTNFDQVHINSAWEDRGTPVKKHGCLMKKNEKSEQHMHSAARENKKFFILISDTQWQHLYIINKCENLTPSAYAMRYLKVLASPLVPWPTSRRGETALLKKNLELLPKDHLKLLYVFMSLDTVSELRLTKWCILEISHFQDIQKEY